MTKFIAFHLSKGYYTFSPQPQHIEQLLTAPNDKPYKVARLRQNYYWNGKTGKVSREVNATGESFISFDKGETYLRLPWFIPNGSEHFYLNSIEAMAEKMRESAQSEAFARIISEAPILEVAGKGVHHV